MFATANPRTKAGRLSVGGFEGGEQKKEGEFAAYFNASIFPLTLTLNVAPRSEPMAQFLNRDQHFRPSPSA
jgi:hypothetical protein